MLNKLPSLFPWKHNKTKIMAEHTMEEAVNLEQELLPCVICGRTFLPDPLAKHTRVCERNATRKRKVFDSLKQRVEGTDLAPFHQKSFLKKSETNPLHKNEPRQSTWKEKHIELVNAIRAAKGTSPSAATSTMTKRSSTTLGTPTHERCPSCDRHFGPKAFDRHVEWCKEKKTSIHKSPASVLLAKERLEARTKYKVPPLAKSKRAVTREKYSPQMNHRTESLASMKSISSCTLDRSPSIRKSKNLLSNKKIVDRTNSNGSQDDKVAERIIKEKVEKSVGDVPVKGVNSEKIITKEVRKSLEPVKSTNKRLLPFSKVNTVSVNDEVEGLTVSQLSLNEVDAKRYVTWKDTVKFTKSDNLSSNSKSKNHGLTPRVEETKNQIACKDIHLETFSNIANQSKTNKIDNCTIKVIVKDKNAGKICEKEMTTEENGKELTRSPKIEGHAVMVDSERKTNEKDVDSPRGRIEKSQRNPNDKTRSPISPMKTNRDPNDKTLLELQIENVTTLPDKSIKVQNVLLGENLLRDEDQALSYNEEFVRDTLTSLKDQLSSYESNAFASWYEDLRDEEVGLSGGKIRNAYLESLKNSRRSSAKSNASKKSKENRSPVKSSQSKSRCVSPRKSSSKSESILVEKTKRPKSKLSANRDSKTLKPDAILPPGSSEGNLSPKSKRYSPKTEEEEMNDKHDFAEGDSSRKRQTKNKMEDFYTNKEDVIVTEYQKYKVMHKSNVQKIHSGDIGVSCLTKYRQNNKIMNCERFLEKNKLISMDLISVSSSDDANVSYVFEKDLRDQCCQTDGIQEATEVVNDVLTPRIDDKVLCQDGYCVEEELKNETYVDSLDGSSINSDIFYDDHQPKEDHAVELVDDLNGKQSRSNMLYQRNEEDHFSEDSVIDGCENCHSQVLSVTRIERGIRRCCSDICLPRSSETSFVSRTEIDLRKLCSYECTSIHRGRDDINLTSDKILEIAGEQFLSSLRNSPHVKTSTPIAQRKVRSPNLFEVVPIKRRKLSEDHSDVPDVENEVKSRKECVNELKKNIEQIREKKMQIENSVGENEKFKEAVKNASMCFMNNSEIEEEIVSQMEIETKKNDGGEMKRILNTIEEASSNASSVPNQVSNANSNTSNNNDSKIEEKVENLIDFGDDATHFMNIYLDVSPKFEILEPIKINQISQKKLHSPKPKNKNQNKYILTDVHAKKRPDSADVVPNVSPRFLHLIRTIIHPQDAYSATGAYKDAEEEFIKISRTHCRKLLHLDTKNLKEILEREPLKLPKLERVREGRKAPPSPKHIKLPPVNSSPRSSVCGTPRKGRIMPLLGANFCRSKIPVRETEQRLEANIIGLPDMVFGVQYMLSPRLNSAFNNNNVYNPFLSAERQLMELLECDEFKAPSIPAPPPTVQNTPRPRTTDNTMSNHIKSLPITQKKKTVKSADPKIQKGNVVKPDHTKRVSVIDPPADFRDRLSMLNDDFDVIESMLNNARDDGSESTFLKFYAKAENNSFNLNNILSHRKYSDDLSSIDPRLINENDNLSIPESLNADDSSPTSTLDNNYYELGNRNDIDHFSENFDHKMSSIEPDGTEIKLKQSISMFDDERLLESGNIDEFVIALSESSTVDTNKSKSKKSVEKHASFKSKKTIKSSKLPKSVEKSHAFQYSSSLGYTGGSASKDKKKNNLASLKRSISLLDPVQKPKTLKNKQDVQNYFNEQEQKSPVKIEKGLGKIDTPVVKVVEENIFVPKAEELFSVDDEMYEEYKKYEEMYLKEKEEKLKKEERRISDGQSGLLTASEDDDSQQQGMKLSGDSAYGSLNRKTPKIRARSTKLTPLESQRNLTTESPNSSSSESSPVIPLTPVVTPKMSKFCHECGSKYPVCTAKFCVECGVKRLVL